MELITSRVKGKTAVSKPGKAPYTRIELDSGHKFNLFDPADIAFIEPGTTYTFTLEQDGPYLNYSSALIATPQEQAESNHASEDRDSHIARAVALKAAVGMGQGTWALDNEAVRFILITAQKFLRFLEGEPVSVSPDTNPRQEPHGRAQTGPAVSSQPTKAPKEAATRRSQGLLTEAQQYGPYGKQQGDRIAFQPTPFWAKVRDLLVMEQVREIVGGMSIPLWLEADRSRSLEGLLDEAAKLQESEENELPFE